MSLQAKLQARLKALDEMESMLDDVDADSLKRLKPSDATVDDSGIGQDKSPPEDGEEAQAEDVGGGTGDTDSSDFDEESDSLPVRNVAAMLKGSAKKGKKPGDD